MLLEVLLLQVRLWFGGLRLTLKVLVLTYILVLMVIDSITATVISLGLTGHFYVMELLLLLSL